MTPEEKKQEKLEAKIKALRDAELQKRERQIKIVILGEPKAWKRERARTGNNGVYAGMYDPNSSTKKVMQDYILDAMEKEGISKIASGPIMLSIDSYKKIPKSMSAAEAQLYEEKILYPETKPDVDNYSKLFMDAANNILWDDDKQVVGLISWKYLSFNPRVEIRINFKEKVNGSENSGDSNV